MDEPTVRKEKSNKAKIGRRRLLKIIAATGGAVAAYTLLPKKWDTPVVDVGVVPVHAQVSPTLQISNLAFLLGTGGPSDVRAQLIASWWVKFGYQDAACQVDDAATLYAYASPCGEIIFDGQALSGIPGAVISGTPCAGTIQLNFGSGACNMSNGSEFCIRLDVGTRESNTLCSPFPIFD